MNGSSPRFSPFTRTPPFQQAGRGNRGKKNFNSPLSSIPVDKFISKSVFSDPWEDLICSLPLEKQNILKEGDKHFTEDANAASSSLESSQKESKQLFSDAWQ